MQQPYSKRRQRWWLYAPLLLVGLLAAAWSGLWFYAAQHVESTIALWIEREAKADRVYACGSRTVGGYPFRIEMRCSAPRAQLRANGAPLVLQGRLLLAVAQVYQPDLVIAEVTGPVAIATGSGAPEYSADWALLQLSLRGLPWAFERVSLVLDDPKLQRTGAAEPLLQAKRFELHARPGAERTSPVFDLAANAAAVLVGGAPRLAGRPIEAEATAVLRGVNDLSPKPLPERLRDWQAAGGKLQLTNARLRQGEAVAVIKGDIGLTAQARLDGNFRVTMAGLEQLLAQLLGIGGSNSQAGILAGLTMLAARDELEGKRAISLPLRFKDGAVFFGPLPLGQTAPLY